MILSQGENLIIIKNEKKNTQRIAKNRKRTNFEHKFYQIIKTFVNIWFTLVQSKF